jgi:hypothetical protein
MNHNKKRKLVKMKIRFLLISLLFFQLLSAQSVRKYSNEFLSIGVDAAAFGMGNTVISNMTGVNAAFWNPAGLNGIKDYQASFMHASYFANIAQYEYAGFAMPLQNKTTMGVSVIRFGVDDILDTTQLIDSNGNIDYNKINLFSAADYALILSLARSNIFKKVDMGINAKIIHRRIGKFATSYGFGFDAGIQIHRDKWHYGLMIRDITTTFNTWSINKEKFALIQNAIPGSNQELPESTEITIPKAQLGITKDWNITRDIGLRTSLETNLRFTQTNALVSSSFISVEPAFGFEADYENMIFLRGGINNLEQELNFDETKSISWQPNFGVGFKYKGVQIDYALTNIASVGNALYSNIFSVKVDFEAFRK